MRQLGYNDVEKCQRLYHFLSLLISLLRITPIAPTSVIEIPDPGFKGKSSDPSLIYVDIAVFARQAAYICQEEYNGHVIRINSPEEKERLKNFVSRFSLPHHYWNGLQWNNPNSFSSQFVWNDGSCTPNSFDNFQDTFDKDYDASKLCFNTHGTSNPKMENEECYYKNPTICEQRDHLGMEYVGLTFHIILQRHSNLSSCMEMCESLQDCFIASPIGHTCVVGLASSTTDAGIIIKEDKVVSNVEVSYSLTHLGGDPPFPCQKWDVPIRNITTLEDYILLDNSFSPADDCSTAAAATTTVTTTLTPTPTASTITSTETVTETETFATTNVVYVTTPVTMIAASLCPSISDTSDSRRSPVTLIHSSTPPIPVSSTTTVLSSSASVTSTVILPTAGPSPTAAPHPPSTRSILPLVRLDPRSLSKAIRARTSAVNKRMSSHVIGYTMAVPFLCLLLIIVAMDMWTRLAIDIRNRLIKNVQSYLRF